MRLFLISVLSLFVVSACSVPMGGQGHTKSGVPLSAEATLGADKNNTVTITSLDGWSCTGSYTADSNSAVRNFPMSCSNGASGNALLSVNAPTAELSLQRASLSFKLNNGESGTVEFGLLS